MPAVKITTRSARPRNMAMFRYKMSPYRFIPFPRSAYARINASCRQIISSTIKSACFNQPSESFRYIFFFFPPEYFFTLSVIQLLSGTVKIRQVNIAVTSYTLYWNHHGKIRLLFFIFITYLNLYIPANALQQIFQNLFSEDHLPGNFLLRVSGFIYPYFSILTNFTIPVFLIR